jgi:hypothetical protein
MVAGHSRRSSALLQTHDRRAESRLAPWPTIRICRRQTGLGPPSASILRQIFGSPATPFAPPRPSRVTWYCLAGKTTPPKFEQFFGWASSHYAAVAHELGNGSPQSSLGLTTRPPPASAMASLMSCSPAARRACDHLPSATGQRAGLGRGFMVVSVCPLLDG